MRARSSERFTLCYGNYFCYFVLIEISDLVVKRNLCSSFAKRINTYTVVSLCMASRKNSTNNWLERTLRKTVKQIQFGIMKSGKATDGLD